MKSRVKTWPNPEKWHLWFAWYPITVYSISEKQCVWWEYIQRKRAWHDVDFQSYWIFRKADGTPWDWK